MNMAHTALGAIMVNTLSMYAVRKQCDPTMMMGAINFNSRAASPQQTLEDSVLVILPF